ncbi:MAG: hypothetical protein AAGA93_21505 [Actinomycetota bacterium]
MIDQDLLPRLWALTDEEFEARYGPLARLDPGEAAGLLDGLDAPWWIVGGWAIEAFTGVHRAHDDVDLSVLADDVPRLFTHLDGHHHLWLAGGGMLCPMLTVDQAVPEWVNQLWVRTDATGPWLLDIIIAPTEDGRWVFRRDPSVTATLDDVTWVADDGLRYQRPEVTLAFKAAHARAKDMADLEAALPALDVEARAWLTDTVARLHPGHAWLDRLRNREDGGPHS